MRGKNQLKCSGSFGMGPQKMSKPIKFDKKKYVMKNRTAAPDVVQFCGEDNPKTI